MLFTIGAAIGLCITVIEAASSAIPAGEQCFPDGLAGFSWLSDYEPAVTYCLNMYPHAATTRTLCALPSDTIENREFASDLSRRHDQEAIFENLLQQRQSTIETVCWCIASSQFTTNIEDCAEGQFCDSKKGICKAARNCQNPARCDPASACSNGGPTGACYCHMDADDPSSGYCMGNGPPGKACPEVFEDCSSNSDCGGSKVCILACCRSEPFCVEVADYSCSNAILPSRLFRRMNDPGEPGMNP